MTPSRQTTASRRPDIDWLRVFATLLLVWFHTNKVFDSTPFYHIKSATVSLHLDLLTYLVHFWHMPLFFVLAGWSAFHSLHKRGREGYTQERRRRLLVPLVFGVLVLCPVLKYYELRSGFTLSIAGYSELETPFSQSFWAFWPQFYTDIYNWSWSHLWFLAYLLTFSLLYRPLMLRWSGQDSRFAPDEAACGKLWRPLVLLCGIQMTLRLIWPGGLNLINDWANFSYYSTFFLLGFLWARHPAWQVVMDRQRFLALALATGSYALMYVYWSATNGKPWPEEASVLAIARLLPVLGLTAVAAYASVISLIAFAHRFANRATPALSYLSEASMPIYVLHGLGLTVPGFYLLQTDLSFSQKYFALLVTGYATTIACYHFLVRPNAYLRPMFGMSAEPPLIVAHSWTSAQRASLVVVIVGLLFFITGADAATPSAPQVQNAATTHPLVRSSGASQALAEASRRAPLGLWYADGGAAKVEVSECDQALCAKIVWLNHPLGEDGCRLRDANNPEPSLRHQLVEGTQIMGDLTPSEVDGVWSDGWVYDPDSGRRYRATLTVVGPHRLDLRGYLGFEFLGRSTTWWRVGSEVARCRES